MWNELEKPWQEAFDLAWQESKTIAEIYDEVIGEYIKIRGDRNGK